MEDEALLNRLLWYVSGLTIASAIAISFMQAQIIDLYGEVDEVKMDITGGFHAINAKLDVMELERRETDKTRMTEAHIKEHVALSVKPLTNKINEIHADLKTYLLNRHSAVVER